MKKILFIIPLSLSIVAAGCNNEVKIKQETTTSTEQTKTVKEDVNVEQFAKLVAQGNGQIVDVRTPEEWVSGIVKGAEKINFFDANFKSKIGNLDKTKPVYVYCKSGGRSGQAAAQMQAMGFSHVYNLIGGMNAWKSEKQTVVNP